MELQESIEPIAARLEQVLRADAVPQPYQEWGRRLLDHLRRPVRIAVTGLPGSGKSSLVNVLLGQPVLPATRSLPMTDIRWGPENRVLFELDSGEMQSAAGTLAEIEPPHGAVRAYQELALPGLQGKSYLELRLDDDGDLNRRILDVALRDIDIVLWCSGTFGDHEQALWVSVPDAIKDHSLLVITKADQQMMRGTLQRTIERLEPVVNEEFLGLYPIAAIQAMTALTAGAQVDPHIWASSGGRSLMAEIDQQVETGRAADVDNARMLLGRYALDEGTRAGAGVASARPAEAAALQREGEGLNARGRQVVDETATLAEAVHMLSQTGRDLLEDYDSGGGSDADDILARCVESISALSTHLRSAGSGARIDEAGEDVQEGEEMMVLFQLERGEDAALDAVTLLLQLRREFAAKAIA